MDRDRCEAAACSARARSGSANEQRNLPKKENGVRDERGGCSAERKCLFSLIKTRNKEKIWGQAFLSALDLECMALHAHGCIMCCVHVHVRGCSKGHGSHIWRLRADVTNTRGDSFLTVGVK